MFVEILNERLSSNYIHFQVYGVNQIFKQTLRSLIPPPLPITPYLRRFYLFQGFLHSEDSGHLELTVLPAGTNKDKILVRGVENDKAIRIAKKARVLLGKSLLGFGLFPPIAYYADSPGQKFPHWWWFSNGR